MSEIDWRAIRADHENGLSLRELTTKYGVSKSVIGRQKFKEQWDRGTKLSSQRVSNPPTRDVNAATRVALALKLRARKLTYGQIAEQAGYGSASACRKAVQRELNRIVVESTEELRREEAYIYDQWHAECTEIFMDKLNKGRLFALDRLIEISRDRRKLLNLDVKPDDSLAGVTIIREYGVEVDRV